MAQMVKNLPAVQETRVRSLVQKDPLEKGMATIFAPLYILACLLCQKADFPTGSDSEVLAYNMGYPGSIHGSGRFPGEGNGNPPQYSCLENPMDGGAL